MNPARPKLAGLLALHAAHRTGAQLYYGAEGMPITYAQGIWAAERGQDAHVWAYAPEVTEGQRADVTESPSTGVRALVRSVPRSSR